MTTVMKSILTLSMANGYRLVIGVLIACTTLLWSSVAQAYSYNSYTVTPAVSSSSTSLGGTATLTVSFTMPMAMTTAGSISFSSPVLYNNTTYSSEPVDMTNASFSSSQLSVSSKSQTYLSLTPSSNLASSSTVSMTISSVINPTSIEGSGTFYISGYESGTDSYSWFSGSASVTYGTIDATVLVTDSNGTTVIPSVSVSLSYSASAPSYAYEYFSGTTDAAGEAKFSGLTSGRTYTTSFSYYGSATTNATPSSGTLTYSGSPVSAEFSFVAPNVSTVFKDASGNAVSGASWYINNSTWTVSKYGTTTSTGVISTGLDADGTYTLSVYDSSYNSYSDTFTVSGCPSSCVVSGLANPLSIPSPDVSGTVTAGGTAVSGSYISAHNDEWTVWRSSTTNSSGAYSLAFGTTDEYVIEVSSYGLPSGYFAPSATRVSVTAGTPQTLNIALSSASKTLSGTVMNGSTAITDAYIYAYQNQSPWGYASTTTNSSGAYTMSLTGGSWNISIYSNTWPSTWTYTGGSKIVEFDNDSAAESETLNFNVAGNTSHIKATFVLPDGVTPVGANEIYMYVYGGEGGSAYGSGYSNASGQVDITVAEGTYNIYAYYYSSIAASAYSMPSFDAVSVDAEATVDIGTQALLSRNSRIEGTASIKSGGAVASVSISAYKDGTWEYAYDTTAAEGTYQLQVSKGKWQVCVNAWGLVDDQNRELIYTGGCETVNVGTDETVGNIDFTFTVADATLTFNTVTPSGTALDNESGWVSVYQGDGGEYGWYSRGCYLTGGSCNVKMSSGIAYSVSFYSYGMWYSSDATTYTYTGMKVDGTSASTVTADQNENQAVSLVMAENNVTITGNVVDENGDAVSIYGYVYASNETGGSTYTYLNGTGSYTLKASAGTWYVSYWSYGDYMSTGNTTTKIVAEENETIEQNLLVTSAGATISGTLLDPNGEPVTTPTYVQASTSYGDNSTATAEEVGEITVGTHTDENGGYEINVPEGEYYVVSSSSEYEINPQPVLTSTTEEAPAADVDMQYAEATAEVTGTIVDGYGIGINNRRASAVGDGVADVKIYAYSLLGNSFETVSDDTGTYTLPAIQGDTMYITAVRQVGTTAYYATTTTVEVGSESVTENVQLAETMELPEPQVATFDPQEPAVVTLADGAEVNMPANSITTENISEVNVVVTPTLEMPQHAQSVTLSYGYVVSATDDTDAPITQLAAPVSLTIPYDEADLTAAGLTEDSLTMGHFEDAAEIWTTMQSTVVDTDNNTFTVYPDSFSKFSVTSKRSVLAGDDGSSDDEDGGEDGGDGGVGDAPDGILEAPNGLEVTSRGATQIALNWSKEGDATSYRVKVVNAKNGKVVKTVNATKSKKVVKKLKSNKKYQFSVRSVGTTGSKSDFSSTVSVRTRPMAPKNLRASAITADGATLTWKAVRGKVSTYVVQVWSGDTVVKTVKSKINTADVSGLEAGSEYSFRVQARFNKKNTSAYSKKKAFSTVLE